MHEKLDPSDKVCFIPVSILRSVSKVFEKKMYHQLYECIENFSINLFKDSISLTPSNILFRILQQWLLELDSDGLVGTM